LYWYEHPVAGSVKVSQVSLCEATFVGRSMERTTCAAPSSAISEAARLATTLPLWCWNAGGPLPTPVALQSPFLHRAVGRTA
jgi:hypothetical protein